MTMQRRLRMVIGAAVMATLASSGLLVGPGPQQARAALVATGMNDSQTVKHDRPTIIPAPGVLKNDLNLLGGATAKLVSGVSHGTLTLRSDGGYTYTPHAGYLGADTFEYRPSGVVSIAATVTITVTNATPVARPDGYSGPARTTLVVAAPGVLANDTDADGDALEAEMVGGGISGSLDLEPNGSLRYTPGGGFSGTATFSYRVWDGLAWSGATTVTLTIAAPAPTPTPAPTRTPSPTATPSPTSTPLLPLPTSSASIPLPSIPLPWLPLPSLLPPTLPVPLLPLPPPSTQPSSTASASASPDTSPGATASPTPSATAVPGQSDGGPASSGSTVGAPPAGAGAGGGPAAASLGGSTGAERGDPGFRLPSTPFGDQRIDLAGASVGLFAGIEIWAVPAATIAFPGLLVLLWVALQTAGAAAWMPAVRRLRGEDDPRRRARLRTPSA